VRRYLLDTNVLSILVRGAPGKTLQRIEAAGERNVYTSIVVAAELRFGAAKKGSDRLTAEVEAVLSRIRVAPLEPPVDRVYADLRRRLEADERPIGTSDLWIAAQALQDGSVMVTDNVGEFGRVPDLKVENWARG